MPACGHAASPHGDPLCAHLQAVTGAVSVDYVRWYTGTGLNVELLCMACAAARERGQDVTAAPVCDACFERATVDYGVLAGVRGKAGFVVRDEPWPIERVTTPLPAAYRDVVDVAPIDGAGRSLWLLLTRAGELVRFDADTGEATRLASSGVTLEAGENARTAPRLRLHVARGGDFAAVVNDGGRFGRIVDLRSGHATLTLDGGDYHPDTVPFSFAFVHRNGRDYAIHRTAWNRLDLSDPTTGKRLTTPPPTTFGEGDERSPHDLDYFHGALAASPDNTRVLSDGWVWHPVGMPTAWRVDPWIDRNPWESEDGPSRRILCSRAYYWNGAVAWIDERRVVVGGIGDDDIAMIDGARCFDVEAPGGDGQRAKEMLSFAGPAGMFFSDGTWLYSANEDGLARWCVDDGARTGFVAGFAPTRFHRGMREFVQVGAGALVRGKVA